MHLFRSAVWTAATAFVRGGGMRPLGEVSQALLQALALSGRATLRELSAHAQISAVDARYALKNLRRATLVCIVDTARAQGYVTTMSGRRRLISDIASNNAQLASQARRQAINTLIQGSAADIIKLAMIRVYNRLNAENLEAELILQVHDELIIDTPKNEQEQVERLIKEEMEGAAQLSVPLTVDVNTGMSWFDVK